MRHYIKITVLIALMGMVPASAMGLSIKITASDSEALFSDDMGRFNKKGLSLHFLLLTMRNNKTAATS